MKERSTWKKESARDLISLGGIPFFLLVLARVYLLNIPEYFNQFVFSGTIFLILFFIFKLNLYSGMGFIVLIFTSLFYSEMTFFIFGLIAYILVIASLLYLKHDTKKVFLGILAGMVGVATGYLLA
ncbi:hypothetical protein KAJ38_00660 [Candidatus Pacearchaeota archaeon]|nr:hypothetical protein [Candidatus Pacearchaeota archaeon]